MTVPLNSDDPTPIDMTMASKDLRVKVRDVLDAAREGKAIGITRWDRIEAVVISEERYRQLLNSAILLQNAVQRKEEGKGK